MQDAFDADKARGWIEKTGAGKHAQVCVASQPYGVGKDYEQKGIEPGFATNMKLGQSPLLLSPEDPGSQNCPGPGGNGGEVEFSCGKA